MSYRYRGAEKAKLCTSNNAKPVQSAATTPQQRGKREPIPFLFRSRAQIGTAKPFRAPRYPQKGGRWSPKRIETTVGGVYPFGNRSRRSQAAKSPARKGRIASQLGCTGERVQGNGLPPVNGVSKSGEIRRSLCQKIRFLRKNGLIKSSQSAIIKLDFYQDIPVGLFRQKKSAFPCTRLRALYHIPFYKA